MGRNKKVKFKESKNHNEISKRDITFGTTVRRSVRPNVQKSKIEGRGRPYFIPGEND